jgi:hypothetical protein
MADGDSFLLGGHKFRERISHHHLVRPAARYIRDLVAAASDKKVERFWSGDEPEKSTSFVTTGD